MLWKIEDRLILEESRRSWDYFDFLIYTKSKKKHATQLTNGPICNTLATNDQQKSVYGPVHGNLP